MRYSKEQKGLLDSQHYKEFLEKRGLKTAIINKTLTFKNINDIEIQVGEYGYWHVGSSLQKISYELYGTIEFWWTIALVNEKPTDAHFSIGDKILAPIQPSVIKRRIGDY
jgi:hypothetical protein